MATIVIYWLLLVSTSIGYVFSDYTYKRPITYAGPIVYSDEKPPIIQFPGPPPANTYREPSYGGGYADSKSSITYVPLPLDDLPILIYQSKDKPPVHVLNRPSKTRQDISGGRFYRTYSSPSSGYEESGPAGTYSGYGRSGGSYEAYSKVGKSYSSGGGSGSSSYYSGTTKQQPPHIVYSGHPPIHVYQQPTTQSSGPSYGQAQGYTNTYNVPPQQLRANHIPAPPTYHRPPIIIYQGVRPPVHVYNEPPPPTNLYGGSNPGYVGGYSSKNGEQWEPVASSAQDVDKQLSPEVKMVTFAAEDKTEQQVLVVSDQDLDLTTEAEQNQQNQETSV